MKLKKVLSLVFVVIILFSGYRILSHIKYERAFTQDQKAIQLIKEDFSPPATDLHEADIEAFRRLQEEIPPLVAWLTIPGTTIDFPIVQGEDNQFYLNHDYQGQANPYGAPFLDMDNDRSFTDQNSIIYGHNDRSNLVFGSLKNYKDPSYWEQASMMELLTDHGKEYYRIQCVYVVDPADNFRSVRYDPEGWDTFTRRWEAKNLLSEPVPRVDDRLLTLQTCEKHAQRLVIHGVHVKP